MLTHPTIEKLHALHLTGMARAWEAQRHVPDSDTLSFEEHLGLLLDGQAGKRATGHYFATRSTPKP